VQINFCILNLFNYFFFFIIVGNDYFVFIGVFVKKCTKKLCTWV